MSDSDKSKINKIEPTITEKITDKIEKEVKKIDTQQVEFHAEKVVDIAEPLRPATYASRVAIILRKLPMLTQKAKSAAYASEVGESFRPVIHKRLIRTLYAISIGYVVVDVAGRSFCVADQGREKMSYFIFDTLLWHSLASLILPAVLIHKIVKFSKYGVSKITGNKKALAWIPAVLALGSVPFIIHPIDLVTDYSLDNVVRPFYVDKIAKETNILRH